MYSYIRSFDGQHLCITHHKSRKEAEKRNKLECMLIQELAYNVEFETNVYTDYEFNQRHPQYAGLYNLRHVHPVIQAKLDKVNGEGFTEEELEIMKNFVNKFEKEYIPLDRDSQKILDDNFWDLV